MAIEDNYDVLYEDISADFIFRPPYGTNTGTHRGNFFKYFDENGYSKKFLLKDPQYRNLDGTKAVSFRANVGTAYEITDTNFMFLAKTDSEITPSYGDDSKSLQGPGYKAGIYTLSNEFSGGTLRSSTGSSLKLFDSSLTLNILYNIRVDITPILDDSGNIIGDSFYYRRSKIGTITKLISPTGPADWQRYIAYDSSESLILENNFNLLSDNANYIPWGHETNNRYGFLVSGKGFCLDKFEFYLSN